MQQKSVGKQFWELMTPLLIRVLVASVVESVVFFVYCYLYKPEGWLVASTQEEFLEKWSEVWVKIVPYATEISGIAALATIPIFILMWRKDRKKEQMLGMIPNKKASLSKYFLVAGVSIPFGLGLNNILLLSNLAEYSEAYQETAESLYASSFAVEILCLGIIIPIMEEFMFRGLIYKRLRATSKPIWAMITSAVFFGIYHENTVQFIYATLSGILFAYLYEKYGSIKAPILAHILMNIVSIVLTETNVFVWMFSDAIRVGVITVACAAIASTVFLWMQKINEKLDVQRAETSSDDGNEF